MFAGIPSVGPVVTSQDTASEIVTTDPATASMITISSETFFRASETTDAAGQLSLPTLTTVIAVTTLDVMNDLALRGRLGRSALHRSLHACEHLMFCMR